MRIEVGVSHWPLKTPFRIARGVKTEAITVTVTVQEDGVAGFGECTPYARYGETVDSVLAALAAAIPALGDVPDRTQLQQIMPAGAARNALDCALWDWQAKATGQSVAALAGVRLPPPCATAFTLSLDAPAAMAAAARASAMPVLKLKLGAGDGQDAARLRAVRDAAPKARLIADVNEGWDLPTLLALDPICAELGVAFIEQPLPADADDRLRGLRLRTPLCADESCHGLDDLDRVADLFQLINIKLDKTGGLTAALALRAAAQARGMGFMVGCMVAGSLAMAPAFLLTDGAAAVDLDGPLLLARDRDPPIRYVGAMMHPPEPALWG